MLQVMSKKHNKKRDKGAPTEHLSVRANTSLMSLRGLTGRATVDSVDGVFRSSMSVLTPFSSDEYWRGYGLDQRTLDRVPIWKLVELLIDLSPDVSKGVWDFQRLFNPGYECTAYKTGKEAVKDEKAQEAVEAFLSQLHGPYSVTNQVPANIVINTISMQAFLRGGMFAELILDGRGKMPLEIATPDPQTIRFKKIDDPERGKVWQLGQYQGLLSGGQGITPLDRPTIIYLPVDPLPGRPFGRPMIQPAIFATLFLIGLLHDLRRVVAQQGYPRLNISVITDKMLNLMPTTITKGSAECEAWFAKVFAEIKSAYSALQPDDAFIAMDSVEVKAPVGAATGSNLTGLTGIDGVIKSLEGMAAKALKSSPFLTQQQGSETNSNRQYEFHIQCMKSIQHNAENLLELLLTIALQVQGIAARIVFRFSENRAAEELRDQQSLFLKLRNARTAYDNGLISQDEQSQMALGKARADQTEPRAAANAVGGQVASINADPGSQRVNPYLKRLPSGVVRVKTIEEVTQERNFAAQALLFTASVIPTADDIDDAEAAFYIANPDAEDILSAEAINESIM